MNPTFQTWAFPVFFIAFFGYRFFKFHQIKKQIPALLKSGATIIDVRSAHEFQTASNPNSINISLDSLDTASIQHPKEQPIIVCCASGTRSGIAAGILKRKGYTRVLNAGPWTNTLN